MKLPSAEIVFALKKSAAVADSRVRLANSAQERRCYLRDLKCVFSADIRAMAALCVHNSASFQRGLVSKVKKAAALKHHWWSGGGLLECKELTGA